MDIDRHALRSLPFAKARAAQSDLVRWLIVKLRSFYLNKCELGYAWNRISKVFEIQKLGLVSGRLLRFLFRLGNMCFRRDRSGRRRSSEGIDSAGLSERFHFDGAFSFSIRVHSFAAKHEAVVLNRN